MADLLQSFGRLVRARRQALALSQEALADLCGFDRTYISMLERGIRNPSLSNLVKLSAGLRTSVSALTKGLDAARTR